MNSLDEIEGIFKKAFQKEEEELSEKSFNRIWNNIQEDLKKYENQELTKENPTGYICKN